MVVVHGEVPHILDIPRVHVTSYISYHTQYITGCDVMYQECSGIISDCVRPRFKLAISSRTSFGVFGHKSPAFTSFLGHR
ncbi:hypothetical protein DPEC_G00086650 [Dallia pectoralis]|uniref:Uncharacterized protein n=1 Tax=Dallia pectoralis TaxID=75939 RepID=A0ACC2H0G0_DALPE|nr:hypothetical protein DPEC_G00086650 [Dallia pectoralis]